MRHYRPPTRPQRFLQRSIVTAALVAAVVGARSAATAQQPPPQANATQVTSAAVAQGVDGLSAGNAAIVSIDLAGTWSFTPAGRSTTSITVPGGGWYKQGFTDVTEAVYSRSIAVPDSGQPQATWIELGAVNHQATLSVDGRVVATQTTAFTSSRFDISAFAAPGTTHTISVDVKGRGALKNTANGKFLVPTAAEWSEAVPQGIFRSATLRVYPAVYISDTLVRTSVADQTLSYDVSVTNSSSSARSVTLTGALAPSGPASFTYPALPSRTVSVPAHATTIVTVGPVAWNLGTTSYWWPNVPYHAGYRAQLHLLSVHASTDDRRTSDATYRFGFRQSTQNGDHYRLNGVQVNYRGDNLQGADYDRINNGGKGDAYDTLPGFLPPSTGNGGWAQAVDNYQRLNYNVVRIHQEPASPFMLDVADELGLMIIDETAIRGSNNAEDFSAGHDNMVSHARALTLRDRNHAAVVRWSQANEPSAGGDTQQFEQDLYAAMNGNDGTRPISIDLAVGDSLNRYPNMTFSNFAVFPHYVDGFGHYGEALLTVAGRPDGEGESIWPKCSSKQGFTWFATATAAKRGKGADDLRPYTLLSAWASVIPGVRTTDFVPEEGGHPVYGADNLPDPWSNPQIQRVQAAFNPIAAIDLAAWSSSGVSDANGMFPVIGAADYPHNTSATRNITVFNDAFSDTSVALTWAVRLDRPDGAIVASGSATLNIPLGSRANQPISFTTPASGGRLYLALSTAKSGVTMFSDAAEFFTLGAGSGPAPGTYRIVNRNSSRLLSVAGNSTADGAPVVQQTGNATWALTLTSDDAYTLRSVTTGKVLDVSGGDPTVGLQLEQWTANGGTNQMWFIRPTGDGFYTLVSHDSGLLVDVFQRATNDGASVVQWTANGGNNQQWQLIAD